MTSDVTLVSKAAWALRESLGRFASFGAGTGSLADPAHPARLPFHTSRIAACAFSSKVRSSMSIAFGEPVRRSNRV